jgi:uncharacterized phage protein (TIGR01671 family)
MNREIKFKAWNHIVCRMSDSFTIEELHKQKINFMNIKFLQCSGLKDSNGIEICEGDILDTGSGSITQVGFKDGGFYYISYYSITDIGKNDLVYFGGHSWLTEILSRFKVVGNIFQNPELLSVGK